MGRVPFHRPSFPRFSNAPGQLPVSTARLPQHLIPDPWLHLVPSLTSNRHGLGPAHHTLAPPPSSKALPPHLSLILLVLVTSSISILILNRRWPGPKDGGDSSDGPRGFLGLRKTTPAQRRRSPSSSRARDTRAASEGTASSLSRDTHWGGGGTT